MKTIYNRKFVVMIAILVSVSAAMVLNSCAVSPKITAKAGVQLWSENCQRCHNTPPPNAFSAEQWETIGMHMQSRALLTNVERDKILNFLKQ
jgi:hypothetical protein